MIEVDLPGFADQVADAQATFRAVLDAMAHPGRIREAGAGLTPPPPLGRAAAAALLTLADHDTPLYLAAEYRATRDWIVFHSGALIVASPTDCAFALARRMDEFTALGAGTHESPESSATLLLEIDALGVGARYTLSGPGLRWPARFAADGLPEDFVELWRGNRERFPCGIDLILCAGARLAALPRSVRMGRG